MIYHHHHVSVVTFTITIMTNPASPTKGRGEKKRPVYLTLKDKDLTNIHPLTSNPVYWFRRRSHVGFCSTQTFLSSFCSDFPRCREKRGILSVPSLWAWPRFMPVFAWQTWRDVRRHMSIFSTEYYFYWLQVSLFGLISWLLKYDGRFKRLLRERKYVRDVRAEIRSQRNWVIKMD